MASKGGPTNLEKEQMFGMAEKEMEYRVDLFNRLTHSCFEKCIEKRHKEAELNMERTVALIDVFQSTGR